MRLIDYGERRLIDEVLAARYGSVRNWGDDAALAAQFESGARWIVATTDPCPPPMAVMLGFTDWFYTGWLLATINLSDIAAAGARPSGLLSSLNLPAETLLTDFTRLLDGLDACCSKASTRVVGGNLKEASEVSLSGTAIGYCTQPPLSRHGARAGDALYAVGDVGAFWAGVLGVRAGFVPLEPGHPLLRNVLVPDPKTDAMSELAGRNLVHAAIDTSDGLYPALAQLAHASGLKAVVDTTGIAYDAPVREAADSLKLDPFRLALGWGDWQVIIACDDGNDAALEAAAGEIPIVRLGSFEEGEGVWGRDGRDAPRRLFPLESERFSRDSWFSAGIEGYVEALTQGPLWES